MILYNSIELGPLLEEDKALLQSIIRMTNPMNLVEFGFLRGHSTRAMLDVMDPNAKLTSYDNTIVMNVPKDERFTLKRVGQEDFQSDTPVDFVFLDASHDFELNKITFEKLQLSLTQGAIIVIHDTGMWFDNVFESDIGYAFNGGYLHCPDERKFVNWIKDLYPSYQQIHFGTLTKISHGITLLQKYYPLPYDHTR